MSISTLIKDNLKFAISQIEVNLTTVPSNGETYSANQQDAESGFEIFEDGREQNIDTKFYICISDYYNPFADNGNLPVKGTILTNSQGDKYKVMSVHDDALRITRRLDCSSEFQR